MATTIRVMLADDHPLIRRGIRAVLDTTPDIQVVVETNTTQDITHLCREYEVGVLVLDINMPGPGINPTLAAMQRDYPSVKVVILSAHLDATLARTVLAAGAHAYFLKDDSVDLLALAIRTVVQGATWYSQRVMAAVVTPPAPRSPLWELTTREVAIFYAILRGHSNAQIAHDFHLGNQTVRNYSSTIYQKLSIPSRTAAIVWAREQGVFPPDTLGA